MTSSLFLRYFEAERYINEGLIRTAVLDTRGKPTRREWMLRFLDDLGHPEKAFPAIHIAGTSGKGSVAMMTAKALHASGLKTGLHTTPYLQVAVEKLWFDGKYAGAGEFIDLVEWIRPICKRWRAPDVPLHGMASFGICLEYFRRKKVDIAVIEVGVGGRDDLTNVIDTKLAVITPIGIDHTKTLGETIDEIATHKAGIIKEGVPVVAYRGAGSKIIEAVAKKKSAPLHWCQAPVDNSYNFQEINKSIAGAAISLSLRAAEGSAATPHSDTKPDPENAKKCHSGSDPEFLPGRLEKLQENPAVIIDGAHNVQKLTALLNRGGLTPAVVLVGVLESKIGNDMLGVLRAISEVSERLILTAPHVYGKEAMDPYELRRLLKIGSAIVLPEPKAALERALEISAPTDTILVTGSLYLAGNIRELYYPSQTILEQRTSWPI